MSISRRGIGAAVVAALAAGASPVPGQLSEESTDGLTVLTELAVLDIDAGGRLFERGIPATEESFSRDGFYFTYLHHIPGGFLRRKPANTYSSIFGGSGADAA